jgi:hypothetical protein
MFRAFTTYLPIVAWRRLVGTGVVDVTANAAYTRDTLGLGTRAAVQRVAAAAVVLAVLRPGAAPLGAPALALGDRLLLIAQADGRDNGVYVVGDTVTDRAPDMVAGACVQATVGRGGGQ